MPLTTEQRKKLHDREHLDTETRKANEYRIRKYAKEWLESLEDILLVLNSLPERQVARLFKKDEDAILLLEIAERALVYRDFMPIRQHENGDLFAEKSLMGKLENGFPRLFLTGRPATDQDRKRYNALQKHIMRLETFVRQRPGVISTDLDRVYFRNLITDVKRNGYKPAEAPEIEEMQKILGPTPEQRWVGEIQRILAKSGIDMSTPDGLEMLKKKIGSE